MRRGEKNAKKKKKEKNVPANKNIVCSDKSIQFCNFSIVFQTLLKSDFTDAVNTSEVLFPQKIFSKIQVQVICKCRLYTPIYSSQLYVPTPQPSFSGHTVLYKSLNLNFSETCLHPVALRMAKTPLSFGLPKCNRVKGPPY